MDLEKKEYWIQAIEVGFKILHVLAENKEAMSLSELSRATKYHKSQLYRYLNTFVHLGVLVRNDEDNPRWSLGPELIALGGAASESLDIVKQAQPQLIKLKNKLNETVALSIWRERGPFFVRWEKSNKLVNIGLDTGSYVPLYTATGKVFRAFLSEDMTNNLYEEEVAAGHIDSANYAQEIQRVKQQNLSITKSSLITGISAISTPIFYPSRILAGALSIVGVSAILDVSPESTPAQELLQAASEISRQFGYTE